MPYLTLSDSKSFLMGSKTGKLRAGWINYFTQGHKQVDLWVGTENRRRLHHLKNAVKHQQRHCKAGRRVAEAPQSPASSPAPHGGITENMTAWFRAKPMNTGACLPKVQATPRTAALRKALFTNEQY